MSKEHVVDTGAATGDEQAATDRPVAAGTVPDGRAAEAAAAAGDAIDESGDAAGEAGDAAGLAAALDAVTSERDEYLALAQRTQADFENYRKRVVRDAAVAELRGVSRLARELLPALDNLDRALAAAGEGADELLLEGLRLVRRELGDVLERVGIESFGAPGERFDPEVHEAVAQQPSDGVPAGEIIAVFQPGYRLPGVGILRPARVMVAG